MLRRLVLVDPLDAGESFMSWVDRTAWLNGCPPGLMVDLLGLPRRATSRDRIGFGFGVVVDAATCEAVQAASSLTPELIRQAHLSAFDKTALSLNGLAFDDAVAFDVAARREWADFYG